MRVVPIIRYSAEWLASQTRATVTAAEAGRVLGVDPRTVRAMIDRGDLTGRRSDRTTYVTIASLRRFIGVDE